MSIKRHQIYKCELCGNIIEVLHAGKPALVCCGEPMKLYDENTTDAAVEKHVPVVEKSDGKIVVSVGSTLHPMQDKHWIEWIQVLAEGKTWTKFLNPGDEPKAEFALDVDTFTVRAYCNVHGLWKAE